MIALATEGVQRQELGVLADPRAGALLDDVGGAGVQDRAPAEREAFVGRLADEVMRESMAASEASTRLDAMLRRSDRDLVVHPSTRLPGAVEIEAEITRRLSEGKLFATCYADLDHFKEFNDRYSYHEGDRVIRILAKILHDVVKGLCLDDGFVGRMPRPVGPGIQRYSGSPWPQDRFIPVQAV